MIYRKKEEISFSLLDLLVPSAQAESGSAGSPELLYIDNCEITVEHGYSYIVALPDTAMAYYSDGTEKAVPVEWDWESSEWTFADEFGQEWRGLQDYDASNPRPMWASVTGYYSDEIVVAEIYVAGLTEAAPPVASMFELVYDQPISVEFSAPGPGGTRIRYSLPFRLLNLLLTAACSWHCRRFRLTVVNKEQSVLGEIVVDNTRLPYYHDFINYIVDNF